MFITTTTSFFHNFKTPAIKVFLGFVLVLFFQINSFSQDKGLPYTRSARSFAIKKIQNYIAVFPGSRYALVKGYKVRLDDVNWKDEAIKKDGDVYVPASFAGILSLPKIKADVAPAYLVNRYIYTIARPSVTPTQARKIVVNGKEYFSFNDLAISKGLKVYKEASGLMIAGIDLITFSDTENDLHSSIITQFDSPEKFADPDIATEFIPTLKEQGKWTNTVKATAAQIQILEGPETKWAFTPKSQFDFTGFNTKLLGSKVPAPGIYPRILFSEQDIPMLAERIKNTVVGQRSMIEVEYLLRKSWWDPTTSDGKVFQQLASGKLDGLTWPEISDSMPITSIAQQFKGEVPGIHNSHVAYVPECLTTMALYCLLTNDNFHGKQTATAIANYFKLREPLIDEWNAVSDSEFGSSYIRPDGKISVVGGNGAATHWRNIHGLVAQMNLGLSLDFAGKWMTNDEKEIMRRVIAKATYGRRAYGQDGPVRFRDINWVAWDLPNYLALAAIEGLEGFDKEAYESNVETIKAFAEWGIDSAGVIYESNGKTPGGMQFQTLSMIALARRGENLWGHPHIRKLLQGQAQMTSPNGRVVVNSGTQYVPFSQQTFSLQTIDEFKAFYPSNKVADYLLSQSYNYDKTDEYIRVWNIKDFNADTYRKEVPKLQKLRMPSPTYPGFVNGLLYSTDFVSTSREDLHLPVDFNDPVHGVFSGYSDASVNATWINMMVRPDHYLGAGHHHADAGMIHFSSLGINWFTESPFPQVYDGKYHNQVLVDGRSEPEGIPGLGTGYQAPAKYMGSQSSLDGVFASADLTNSYSYRWQTQPGQAFGKQLGYLGWELDPSEENLKKFAGTARYKMRPWWATYNYSNYMPTSRSSYNPMKYVYRSVGLVRGKHAYGLVTDDLKKDDQDHLYQWTAMLNGGIWQANVAGLSKGQLVLASRPYDVKEVASRAMITPKTGDPLLLVCAVSPEVMEAASYPFIQVITEQGPADKQGKAQFYDRISINSKGKSVSFRVLLIPFRYGDEMPIVETKMGKTTIKWKDQADIINFATLKENRNIVKVERDGKVVCESR